MSKGIYTTLWRHRSLVWELTKRDFAARYRGTFAGVLWSFVQPLFLLAVYTVAFGAILQVRWPGAGKATDYAFLLFAGLILFNAFADCLRRAPHLVTANPNYVKKVVFPLEVLPVVMALGALAHAALGIAVWLVGYGVMYGTPKLTVLYSPLVLVALFPVLLGVGWLMSAGGVVVRDVGQSTDVVAHALLFLTPIFYSAEAVPGGLRQVLMANPLTFVVEQFRRVLFAGAPPDIGRLSLYLIGAAAFSMVSLRFFRRLRPRFAEFL